MIKFACIIFIIVITAVTIRVIDVNNKIAREELEQEHRIVDFQDTMFIMNLIGYREFIKQQEKSNGRTKAES